MELIPGLPDDIGRECLVRVPYEHFSSVSSVCRSWKLEFQLPEFWQHRKRSGLTRQVVVVAQAQSDPTHRKSLMKCSATPTYQLSLCEPETGSWARLPPVPGIADGLPMFCQLVGVGLNLVVLGGWNPTTWEVSNAVYVFDFVSGTWRRGSDMPGCPRSFFACSSDSDRTVFVAGGHDDEKNALRSGATYDVEEDKWVPLPDMAQERDECKGVFHRGKFHVVGGYSTDMQGRFGASAEAFDVSTWQWGPVQEDLLEMPMCPRTCVEGGDHKLYMCRGGDVVAMEASTWQVIAELPADARNIAYVTALKGGEKLLLIGSLRFSEPHSGYVLDLKSRRWTKVETPGNFSGHVQSGCCLEI